MLCCRSHPGQTKATPGGVPPLTADCSRCSRLPSLERPFTGVPVSRCPVADFAAGATLARQQPYLEDSCPSLLVAPDAAVCPPFDGLHLVRLEVLASGSAAAPGSSLLTNQAGNSTELPYRSAFPLLPCLGCLPHAGFIPVKRRRQTIITQCMLVPVPERHVWQSTLSLAIRPPRPPGTPPPHHPCSP